MPKRMRPEFSYNEKTGLYRKRLTLPDGRTRDLYARDPAVLRKKVVEAMDAIQAGRYSRENPTVAEYAVRWCERRLPGLSEARQNDYRGAINNHILPGLGGNTPLKEVTCEDVERLMASKANMSNSLTGKIMSTLKQLFASAVKDGIIKSSPCEGLKARGRKAQEKTPLTSRQQESLIDAVMGTAAHPFVMLGLYAGLRKEEILGLKWDCVHLAAAPPYLEVERTVTYIGNQAKVSNELKSRAARRRIPIPPALHQCLLSWRIQNPHGFVIPNSEGGPRSRQSFRRLWEIVENRTAGTMQRWDKVEKKNVTVRRELGVTSANHKNVRCTLDFHCTPHLLRHTYITNLCASGMDIKKIQYLAGHATVQMTLNIYAHVVGNRPEDLFEDIAAALSSGSSR